MILSRPSCETNSWVDTVNVVEVIVIRVTLHTFQIFLKVGSKPTGTNHPINVGT